MVEKADGSDRLQFSIYADNAQARRQPQISYHFLNSQGSCYSAGTHLIYNIMWNSKLSKISR